MVAADIGGRKRLISAVICEKGIMSGKGIVVIIILVLLLVLAGVIYYTYTKIRESIRKFSNVLFGTDSLMEGMKTRETEVAITPKSVSGATNLYLPAIMRDFPEFHYDEMKTRAENVLLSYLRSVDTLNSSVLTEGTNELRQELDMKIQALKNMGQQEHFQNVMIHKTEIYQYRKNKGRVSVIFQTAVEYIHYLEDKSRIIKGRNDLQEQTKYNIEVIYIQDQDFVEDMKETGLGLHCPNCGAPVSSLGVKVCEYCDSPVIEFNMRTWSFSKVKRLK